MTKPFAKLPQGTLQTPDAFKVHISDEKLEELQQNLKLSRIGTATYEGTHKDRKWGIETEWLKRARSLWLDFDWRKTEDDINSFPNYTMDIMDNDTSFNIHFVALFSEKSDAVPIMLLHGWPGSFLEFMGILELLTAKYTPGSLPYHVIVPSWPGYCFSSAPPLDRDFKTEDVARIFNNLMIQLGFKSGYVTQGGDLGSRLSRILNVKHPEVKAAHLNYNYMADPGNISDSHYSQAEKDGLQRSAQFQERGSGYGLEHSTKPSTIGHVVSSSPIALLAWIGEKLLDWTDQDPSMDKILELVTLYWLTDCFSTTIYPYRERFTGPGALAGNPEYFIKNPVGFSWFPKEIGAVPQKWIETTGNLVFFRAHERGGHFAALEQPEALLSDLEEFVTQVWSK